MLSIALGGRLILSTEYSVEGRQRVETDNPVRRPRIHFQVQTVKDARAFLHGRRATGWRLREGLQP